MYATEQQKFKYFTDSIIDFARCVLFGIQAVQGQTICLAVRIERKELRKIVVVVESVNLGKRPVFPHNRAVCRLFWRWEEMEQNL